MYGRRRAAAFATSVHFGGRSDAPPGAQVGEPHRWVDTEDIYAIGFDQLIPGNRSPTVNHLRLWSGRAHYAVPYRRVQCGQLRGRRARADRREEPVAVLYPDDSTPQGKELRLKQQYFFVSASLQDMLATHLSEGRTLDSLPDAIAIQLNDTHPALAIPELMRLLVDEHGLAWDERGSITTGVFSYTNHTLLPEALETWPVALFERLLPRHLEIIYLINRDFLQAVATRYPGDLDRQRRLSIIDERRRTPGAHGAPGGDRQPPRQRRGAAAFRADAQAACSRGFAEMYPDRFINVTNGIAVRRWLKQSNPGLSALLTRTARACLGERPRGARPT